MSRLPPQLQIWEQIIQQVFLQGRYLSLILDYFSKKDKALLNFYTRQLLFKCDIL